MANKTIFLYVNPEFDKRHICGISKIYQFICNKNNYNLKIVNLKFLKKHIPQKVLSQKLIVVGGDGTIHKILNILPEKALCRYIFGFIPTGTANEFTKSIEIPKNLKKALKLAVESEYYKEYKLGIINDKIKFTTGILYGLASQVLLSTPQKLKHYLGIFAFNITFLLNSIKLTKSNGKLTKHFTLNENEIHTNFLLINNAHLKSKMVKSKELEIYDKDKLAVVHLHSKLNKKDFLRILFKELFKHKILIDKDLIFQQFDWISLKFKEETTFLIDGEAYNLRAPLQIKHYIKSINIITP